MWDAEQAEIKAKQEILDKRQGLEEKGKDLLSSFLNDVYLPWSKASYVERVLRRKNFARDFGSVSREVQERSHESPTKKRDTAATGDGQPRTDSTQFSVFTGGPGDNALCEGGRGSQRVAVEALKLSARKNVQVSSWPKQPPVPAAVSR